MKVAVVTASMSRQAGGLFYSVRHLTAALQQHGAEICVNAGADSDSVRDFKAWGNARVAVGPVVGPAIFGFQPELRRRLKAEDADLVHLHGLWMYPSLATLKWSEGFDRPRVISPRGMLDSWALQRSAWKKRLVSVLFETRNLQGAACLHALNEAEYLAIRAHGLTTPVAVIPNGVATDEADRDHLPPAWAGTLPEGARVLLFLGRLHPKKGLPELLEALAQLNGSRLADWYLVIAGWDQGGHEAVLRQLVAKHNLTHRVRFVGPQFGAEKSATLAHADAFVLPSHSEGLPMAVLEAWSFRLPVLMTDACNLQEGFSAGAALRLEIGSDGTAFDVYRFLKLDRMELDRMGRNGRDLVERRFGWDQIAAQMHDVYAWVLGRADRPECVRMN